MESEIEQLLNFKPSNFSSSDSEDNNRELASEGNGEAPQVKSLRINKNVPSRDRLDDKDIKLSEHQLLSYDVAQDNDYSDLFKLSISNTDSEIDIDKSVIEEVTSFFHLMDDAINKYTKIYNPPQQTHQSVSKEQFNIEELENLNIYVTNFYNVTQKLLKSKQSQKNYTLAKSITFALGDKFFVAISDISGCIIFYNLKSKSIELLEGKSETTGYCTALEFSKDSRYLLCGFYMGDIKIYEVSSLMIVQTFSGIFLNPVVGAFPYNDNEFIVHDNSSTMASINVKRNYFMINNFEIQTIDFFSTYKILCTDICAVQIDGRDKGSMDLMLVCLDKTKVSLFQITPVRKNIELFYLHDYLTCVSCGFSKSKYTPKKDIYFYILASTSLLFYSLPRTENKFTSQPILTVDITTNYVYAIWMNEITIALIDERMKKVVLYNLQIKKAGNEAGLNNSDSTTKDGLRKSSRIQRSETMDVVTYKKSEENIQEQMQQFEPVNKFIDTIKIRVMKTAENPQHMTAIDHKGQVVDLKLKNWREYFDNLLENKPLNVFLARFDEVFEGDYCFFNDYIQDKTSRERIMVSYLQDKVQRLLEETPAVAENHITGIMSLFFSMKQYEFVFDHVHKHYESKNLLYIYYNKLEPFLNKKIIRYLHPDFAINLIEYYTKTNQHDIVMLILGNLEAQSNFIDKLVDFCIVNNFWISLIIVCFNSKPPCINKLLSILRTEIDFKRGSDNLGYHPEISRKLSTGNTDRKSAAKRKNSMPVDIIESLVWDKKQASSIYGGAPIVSEDDFKDLKKVLFWVYHFFLEKSISFTNLNRTYYDVVIGEFYDMLCDGNIIELFVSISLQDFIKILLSFYNQRNYGALRKTYFKGGKKPTDLLRIINIADNLSSIDKIFFGYLFDEMLDFVDDESTINEPVKHYNDVLKLLRKEDKFIFKEYTEFLCDSLEKNVKLFNVDELSQFISKIIELYSFNTGSQMNLKKPSVGKIANTEPNFNKTEIIRTPSKCIEPFNDTSEPSLSHSALLIKSNTAYKEEGGRKTFDPTMTSHEKRFGIDLHKKIINNPHEIKTDFLDEMKSSIISQEYRNEKPVNLSILSLLTDILYRIEEYDTIFRIWALKLTIITKKYMFHFLAKKIFNINLQMHFIQNLVFFTMCNIEATFDIFDLFDILPHFDEIEVSLDNLYGVKLKFYDYMLKRYKEACYERKLFFHNYVEALIKEEDENAILNFVQKYAEHIEIFDVLKFLSGTKYYRVFAFLHEQSKDEVKAFNYYFLIIKNLHLQLGRVDMNNVADKFNQYLKKSVKNKVNNDFTGHELITPIKKAYKADDIEEKQASPKINTKLKRQIWKENSVDRLKSRSNIDSRLNSSNKHLKFQTKQKNTNYFFIDKDSNMRNINELVDILERKLKFDTLITASILSQSSTNNSITRDDLHSAKKDKNLSDKYLNNARAKDTADLLSEDASCNLNPNKISPFTNINAITINDMMNFCKNNSHKQCMRLKSLFMLQVIILQPKSKLQDLVLDFENKLPVYSNILNEISIQMLYYKRIEIMLDKDLKRQRAANYIVSSSFDRKCPMCNKPFSDSRQKDDKDFVVAKPVCGHIYHNSCATKFSKRLNNIEKSVDESNRGQRRRQNDNNLLTCKVCEFIIETINQKTHNPNTANRIMSTISNVVEPVNDVLNVFKTATVGIFGVLITFGMSEKNLQPKQETTENVVRTQRKSLTAADNKDKFKKWVDTHIHTGLQIKLDKLRNDDIFKSRFLNL